MNSARGDSDASENGSRLPSPRAEAPPRLADPLSMATEPSLPIAQTATNSFQKSSSTRRRIDADNVLLYIPPERNTPERPSTFIPPHPSLPSNGGVYNNRMYKRNDSLCSTQGTKVTHLRKIVEDPEEVNITKKQLARELLKYDVDGDGWVSTGEMLEAIIDVVDRLTMNVTDLDRIAQNRGEIGKKVARKLREKDKDGDGAINADELVDAMEELVREEESGKFWFRFSMVSCLLTLITIVVIVGLTVALQISLKDTKVDSSSNTLTAYRGSGQSAAVRVASSDFSVSPSGDFVPRGSNSSSLVNVATKLSTATDCPTSFDAEYLRHIQVIEFDLNADDTLYLKPAGFIIGSNAVTFFTQLGNIIFSNNCQQMEGEVIDYLVKNGLMDLPSAGKGRRLSQTTGLVTSSSLSKVAANKPPKPPPLTTIYVSVGSAIDCNKNPPPAGCIDSGCNISCADNGLCLANFYRQRHGSPLLTYNKTLEGYAQQCVANTSSFCVLNDCTTGLSGTSAYELETTKVNRTAPTACDALTAWYIEVAQYVFSKTPFTDNLALFDDPNTPIGHFSQLMWRNSSSIGCGTASKAGCVDNTFSPPLQLTNSWFINCNYWPPGNLVASTTAASDALWQAQVCPVGGC